MNVYVLKYGSLFSYTSDSQVKVRLFEWTDIDWPFSNRMGESDYGYGRKKGCEIVVDSPEYKSPPDPFYFFKFSDELCIYKM
jgi:hypothetical protein